MDIAIYRHAGRTEGIVANDFDGWSEERRNSRRPYLQCPACSAPARFRRKSRDGKNPCFFARHESGCAMASSSRYVAAVVSATTEEVEQIIKDTSVIEVVLGLPDRNSRPGGPPTRTAGAAEFDGEGRASRRHTKKSTKPEKPSCVGGERLLRYLVCSADFRQADIKIRIPGMRNEFTASRLFRSFSDIAVPAGGTEGKWHGFWGRLTGSDADMACLNTGDSDAACIIVDEKIRHAVYGRWKMTRRNVTGAYCLVFGKPKLSQRGHAYIKVFSEDRIVFCPGNMSDITDKLDDVYAGADTLSSPDPGLQTLQAYSLDILRKDDWT